MPTYTVKHIESGETKEMFCTISEMEQFQKDHPECEVLCGSPLLHSGRGMSKPDDNFRSLLKQIKKNAGSQADVNTF